MKLFAFVIICILYNAYSDDLIALDFVRQIDEQQLVRAQQCCNCGIGYGAQDICPINCQCGGVNADETKQPQCPQCVCCNCGINCPSQCLVQSSNQDQSQTFCLPKNSEYQERQFTYQQVTYHTH